MVVPADDLAGKQIAPARTQRLAIGLLVQDRIAPVPQLRCHDRFAGMPLPLLFRLEMHGPAVIVGIVRPAHALGGRIAQHHLDALDRERLAPPRAIAALIELARYRPFAVQLGEEFVDLPANGRLIGMWHQLPVDPVIAVGGGPRDALTHLGACDDGRLDALDPAP